jgi:hypothetical protein
LRAAGKKAGFVSTWVLNMTPRATPQDGDCEWLDEMVTKLQREFERQLERVSLANAESGDARERAADARTLNALERTLERLAALERERAAVKEKKIAKHDGSARATLERRLDKRLASARARGPAGKPD